MKREKRSFMKSKNGIKENSKRKICPFYTNSHIPLTISVHIHFDEEKKLPISGIIDKNYNQRKSRLTPISILAQCTSPTGRNASFESLRPLLN